MQELLDRINAAPGPLRLTDDDLAKLEAYMETHRPRSRYLTSQEMKDQVSSPETTEQIAWKGYRFTVTYNRELRTAGVAPVLEPRFSWLRNAGRKACSVVWAVTDHSLLSMLVLALIGLGLLRLCGFNIASLEWDKHNAPAAPAQPPRVGKRVFTG